MSSKRRIPLKKLNTNVTQPKTITTKSNKPYAIASEIKKIIVCIQNDLTSHQHYIQELRRMHSKMEHDEFMNIIIPILQFIMQQPEDDFNANTVLRFICNFLATYKDDETENPYQSIFNFVLSTEGANPHIRFRLCELVNILLNSLGDATLDEEKCSKILSYMLNRLKSGSAHVRAQAIYALERLQVPNDPDDVVTNYFIYHIEADPSAKVREAVISKLARTSRTIPIIMERLQDLEERVRRHTYIKMMKGFPVKSYRIAQRLTFLESGLTDESLSIRKIVSHLMITEWLASYNDDFLSFLRALKLNGSDEELQRYHNASKYVLRPIFQKNEIVKLFVPLAFNIEASAEENQDSNEEDEPRIMIPIENLTLELSIFWTNLAEYLYEEKSNELELLLPDLMSYCEYITSYNNFKPDAEKQLEEWEELERKYILKNLIKNLTFFDYSDDVLKNNLQHFICQLLRQCDLHNHSIKVLLTIMEKIVPDNNSRFMILNKIVFKLYPSNFEFVSDRPSLQSPLRNVSNKDVLFTVVDLKIKIMDFQEQFMNYLTKKDYENAEKISEKLNQSKQEYNKTLMPFVTCLPEQEANSIMQVFRTILPSTTLQSLKIVFYMLSSEVVSALTPSIIPLYSEFIRRYIESNQMNLREWALKCGTTYALLHEQFSHDMLAQLRKQFFLEPYTQIWDVSIRGMFQLLVRYNLGHLSVNERIDNETSTSKLYHHKYDFQQATDIKGSSTHVSFLSFMLHILDTCTDTIIFNTIIEGFCLLCLNAKYACPEIISKLMITYFDPATESKSNQLLGVFFKNLIGLGKSIVLEAALLPTINKIVDAGSESSLGEVKPENVIRFVINATGSKYCPGLNIHEIIAESFLKEIRDKLNTSIQLVIVLSTELVRLHVNQSSEKKSKLLEIIEEIFSDYNGTEKIKPNLIKFQKLLNGELTDQITTVEFSSNAIDTSVSMDDSNDNNTNKIKEIIPGQKENTKHDSIQQTSKKSKNRVECGASSNVGPSR